VIDVYKGNIKAEHHFGYYATFISFFPQLVAGPIERTENLLPQIKAEHSFDYKQATYGLKLMAWGFFKKLAIADVLSTYVDSAYSSLNTCTGFDLLVAIFFFTIQIYCDFSGYSDIAIGTTKLLGINLMTNFKSPYFATSIKDFWGRWHISLSTWFKDYVYIPLGGNRCSQLKRDRNLLITFLTSGLWHGANWTYILWGGLHGIAQIFENHLNIKRKSKVKQILSWMFVFLFCNIAWVFFRAETVQDACFVLNTLIRDLGNPTSFFVSTINLSKWDLCYILFTIVLLSGFDYASLKTDVIVWVSEKNMLIRWILYFILISFILLFMNTQTSEFVYFQF
jgi:D-alanyl-lipoteichoic acid acyltransferase DltB (MBOAT superfamily)